MANDFYDESGAPSTASQLSSATVRSEFAAIGAGFDKMPTLTGNGSKMVAVNSGGTALEAVTAASARSNLGLVIGTDVQAYDALLLAVAALVTAADKMMYFTGVDTVALADLTAAGRALLDDASAGDQRTTLGLGTIATQAANNVAITGGSVTGVTGPAMLAVEDQALTGGVIVTSKSLGTISSGTVTPDPGDRPLQHYTNGGAHTLAPSANNGSVLVDITNDASAGAITTSGFTAVTGSAFTTTNGHKFRCHISIGNAGSLLQVQALQ